jgi:hypothetical protein
VPWAKLVRGKDLFRGILRDAAAAASGQGGEASHDRLADRLMASLLKDGEQCEAADTGYPELFERLLAKICIPGVRPWVEAGWTDPAFQGVFGTVCHTVVLVGRDEVVRFYEESRDSVTGQWEARHKFTLRAAT